MALSEKRKQAIRVAVAAAIRAGCQASAEEEGVRRDRFDSASDMPREVSAALGKLPPSPKSFMSLIGPLRTPGDHVFEGSGQIMRSAWLRSWIDGVLSQSGANAGGGVDEEAL